MDFNERLTQLRQRRDADVIAYFGRIDRRGYAALSKDLSEKKLRKNAFLLLESSGGDAHAGYRIARAIRHHYKGGEFVVFLPGRCKSAATLVCIGASALVIGDTGELGPLDVQVNNPSEVFGSNSGLDLLKALTHIRQSAYDCFRDNLIEIRDLGLSTKIASDIASQLAVGLHSPIFGQIDPIRLGEIQRQMEIAVQYGTRLNKYSSNLVNGEQSLNQLVTAYPSHSFVIDRKEARDIFKRVEAPDENETAVSTELEQYLNADGASWVALFQEPRPSPAQNIAEPGQMNPPQDPTSAVAANG